MRRLNSFMLKGGWGGGGRGGGWHTFPRLVGRISFIEPWHTVAHHPNPSTIGNLRRGRADTAPKLKSTYSFMIYGTEDPQQK